MLRVSIGINNWTLYARTAVNREEQLGLRGDETPYEVDTGEIIYHRREDGAVALAHKLLDTIKEQK